jgi:pilus assembly protein CpaD
VAFALSACKHIDEEPVAAGWSPVDATQRHPIMMSQEPHTIPIHVARGGGGLSPRQRADLLAFSDRARASDAGNSRLVISVPAGGANEIAAMQVAGEVRGLLSTNGFSETSIAVEAYHDGSNREPPIRVSYLRYVAKGPECGSWPTNLARERDNIPYPNFGCATQHNFAAMVANPADLLGPRTESDRASERRDAQWDKYVNGESTTANKSEDEKVQAKSSN